MSFVAGKKYFQKGGQPIAFRNEHKVVIGKNLDKETDLCFPIKQTGITYVAGYDLPVGTELMAFKTGISYWNYDYFFKTKEFTKKEFWRFSRAYNRYFKKWTFGDSEEASFKIFLDMQRGRYNRAPYTYKLKDHSKHIQQAIKELTPEQFGHSGWGLL